MENKFTILPSQIRLDTLTHLLRIYQTYRIYTYLGDIESVLLIMYLSFVIYMYIIGNPTDQQVDYVIFMLSMLVDERLECDSAYFDQ